MEILLASKKQEMCNNNEPISIQINNKCTTYKPCSSYFVCPGPRDPGYGNLYIPSINNSNVDK